MINNNVRKLVLTILEKRNEYITIDELSEISNLSTRTIYHYLDDVKTFFLDNNLDFSRKYGRGYKVEGSLSNFRKIEGILNIKNLKTNSDLRILKLKFMMLNEIDSFTIDYLAEHLYTSNSQIQRDLKTVDKWFKDLNIKVIKKKGVGIYILAKESDIRLALFQLNRDFILSWQLREKNEIIYDSRINLEKTNILASLYGIYNINNSIMFIQEFESNYGKFLDRDSFDFVLSMITIILFRIEKKFNLNDDWELYDYFPSRKVESAVKNVAFLISKCYRVNVSDIEFKYIYTIFMCSEFIENFTYLEAEEKLKETVDNTIDYISRISNQNFKKETYLLDTITSYYLGAIYRVSNSFSVGEIDSLNIKNKQPELFNACLLSNRFFQDYTANVPTEREISKLCQVISLGNSETKDSQKYKTLFITRNTLSFSNLIKERLEESIKQLEITIITDIEKLNEANGNLIISDFKIPVKDYVLISNNLDDSDIFKVKEKLYELKKYKVNKDKIADVFSEDYILIKKEYRDREELLKDISNKLIKEKYVFNDFYEDVVRRENISSTYIGNGIAMPHCLSYKVKKPIIVVINLVKPINWDGNKVDLVFLNALDFSNVYETKFFFETIHNLLSEDISVNRIKKAKSPKDILNIIEGGIHND